MSIEQRCHREQCAGTHLDLIVHVELRRDGLDHPQRHLQRLAVGMAYAHRKISSPRPCDDVETICDVIYEEFSSKESLSPRYPNSAPTHGRASSLIAFVEVRSGHDLRYDMDTSKNSSGLRFAPMEAVEIRMTETVRGCLDSQQ
jgi:dTDP-D-glucose 4,6-dehydratase